MEKFKIEVLFNEELVLEKEYEGFENGIEFAVNVSEDIKLGVPEDTYVKVILATPKYNIPFKQIYLEGEGNLNIEKQIMTLKIGDYMTLKIGG